MTNINRTAIFSPDKTCRYRLTRSFAAPLLGEDYSPGSIGFVMLNPSIADDDVDDPTIRKCCGFAKRWGYGRIMVTNLIPLIATDPWTLPPWKGFYAENIPYIERALDECATTVVAWGSHPKTLCRTIGLAEYIRRFRELAGDRPLHCIGLTKQGDPLHPSRTAYTDSMMDWVWPEA
jgi:hypothetical protein